MSKILISILLSLGLCSGDYLSVHFNKCNKQNKSVQTNQSISNEALKKAQAKKEEEAKSLSINPYNKNFSNIDKNFSKENTKDTAKKEELTSNISKEKDLSPSKDKQEEKAVKDNKVDKELKEDSSKKQEDKPLESQTEKQEEKLDNRSFYASEIEQIIFNKVNEERVKAGVTPLSYNNTMQKYARIKSEDMAVRKYFSHEDPNGQLITVKMKSDGISYNAWGENIAYLGGYLGNSNIANKFMTNWMNSKGHRENILSQNVTSIGIGVYKIGDTYYATQEFIK